MMHLVIEYVFEGPRRGYNITSPTHGLSEDLSKLIWRTAMPRGQGWGAYIGARSLKHFPLNDHLCALADVQVTDQADESGRRGIRRAEIEVMTHIQMVEHLLGRLQAYPPAVQSRLDKLPSVNQWRQIIDHSLPKMRRDAQVILTHDYRPEIWPLMEALVIKLALSKRLMLKRTGKTAAFTTLTLDPREEMALIAMPTTQMSEKTPDTISIRLS
jgi:hypothetical protein